MPGSFPLGRTAVTSILDDSGDATTKARAGGRRAPRWDVDHPHYRWGALSNTTIGMLIATVNASIVLISLPAIFRGIGMNPLAPENVGYLLWMIMGYLLVSARSEERRVGEEGR